VWWCVGTGGDVAVMPHYTGVGKKQGSMWKGMRCYGANMSVRLSTGGSACCYARGRGWSCGRRRPAVAFAPPNERPSTFMSRPHSQTVCQALLFRESVYE